MENNLAPQSPQTPQIPQVPQTPLPGQQTNRKKVLIALLVIVAVGAIAYLLSTGKFFKGAFLALEDQQKLQQVMEETSTAENADYEVAYKNNATDKEGRFQSIEMKATGKVDFLGSGEGSKHTFTFSGEGWQTAKPGTEPPTTPPVTTGVAKPVLESPIKNAQVTLPVVLQWKDPDNKPESKRNYEWYIRNAEGQTVWSRTWTNGDGGPLDCQPLPTQAGTWTCQYAQVPAGKLEVGKTYSWAVEASDGTTGSGFTEEETFTVVKAEGFSKFCTIVDNENFQILKPERFFYRPETTTIPVKPTKLANPNTMEYLKLQGEVSCAEYPTLTLFIDDKPGKIIKLDLPKTDEDGNTQEGEYFIFDYEFSDLDLPPGFHTMKFTLSAAGGEETFKTYAFDLISNTGLALDLDSLALGKVNLKWETTVPSQEKDEYWIVRGAKLPITTTIKKIPTTETVYVDDQLGSEKEYYYQILRSGTTSSISSNVIKVVIPTATLSIEKTELSEGEHPVFTWEWEKEFNPLHVDKYFIYRSTNTAVDLDKPTSSTTQFEITDSKAKTFTDNAVKGNDGSIYHYALVLKNKNGEVISISNQVNASFESILSKTATITLVGKRSDDKKVNLQWTGGDTNPKAQHYVIYRAKGSEPQIKPENIYPATPPIQGGTNNQDVPVDEYGDYTFIMATSASDNIYGLLEISNPVTITLTEPPTLSVDKTDLTQKDEKPKFTWTEKSPAAEVSGYTLYRSKNKSIEIKEDGTTFDNLGIAGYPKTGETELTDEGLVLDGGTYYYRLVRKNLQGQSISNEIVVTTKKLADSIALTAKRTGDKEFLLSWSGGNIAQTKEYKVLWKPITAEGMFYEAALDTQIKQHPVTVKDYGIYAAKVAAINEEGKEWETSGLVNIDMTQTPSLELKAEGQAGAQKEVTLPANTKEVKLTWSTSNLDNIALYTVFQSKTSPVNLQGSAADGVFQFNVNDPAATSYTDTSILPGTYYYVVIAKDKNGAQLELSKPSNEVKVTIEKPATNLAQIQLLDQKVELGQNYVWVQVVNSYMPKLDKYWFYKSTSLPVDTSDEEAIASLAQMESKPGQMSKYTTHIDNSFVGDGKPSYYKVLAKDKAGNIIGESNEIVVKPIVKPAVLTLDPNTGIDKVTFKLQWTDEYAAGKANYDIYTSTEPFAKDAQGKIILAEALKGEKIDSTQAKEYLVNSFDYAFDRYYVVVTQGLVVSNEVVFGNAAVYNITDLTAVAGNQTVTLTWKDKTDPADILEYQIYRGEKPLEEVKENVTTGLYYKQGILIGKTNPDTKTFTDAGLENGKAYYYTIVTKNKFGKLIQTPNQTTATPAAPVSSTGGFWKPFASLFGADVLSDKETSPYLESISGGGELTQTATGLEGKLTINHEIKQKTGETMKAKMEMTVQKNAITNVKVTTDGAGNSIFPNLDTATLKIDAFLAEHLGVLGKLKNGIQANIKTKGFVDSVDTDYQTSVAKFIAPDEKPASYLETATEDTLKIGKPINFDGNLAYTEGRTFSFKMKNFKFPVKVPAVESPKNLKIEYSPDEKNKGIEVSWDIDPVLIGEDGYKLYRTDTAVTGTPTLAEIQTWTKLKGYNNSKKTLDEVMHIGLLDKTADATKKQTYAVTALKGGIESLPTIGTYTPTEPESEACIAGKADLTAKQTAFTAAPTQANADAYNAKYTELKTAGCALEGFAPALTYISADDQACLDGKADLAVKKAAFTAAPTQANADAYNTKYAAVKLIPGCTLGATTYPPTLAPETVVCSTGKEDLIKLKFDFDAAPTTEKVTAYNAKYATLKTGNCDLAGFQETLTMPADTQGETAECTAGKSDLLAKKTDFDAAPTQAKSTTYGVKYAELKGKGCLMDPLPATLPFVAQALTGCDAVKQELLIMKADYDKNPSLEKSSVYNTHYILRSPGCQFDASVPSSLKDPNAVSSGGGGGGGGGGGAPLIFNQPIYATPVFPPIKPVSPYADVVPGMPGYDAIIRLSTEGVLEGYTEKGKKVFKPNKLVNRAEASKLILKSVCVEPTKRDYDPKPVFGDITNAKEWYFPLTKETYFRGYFTGYKDTMIKGLRPFKPNNNITRAELTKVLVEVLRREGLIEVAAFQKTEPWWTPFINIAKNLDKYWTGKAKNVEDLLTDGEAKQAAKSLTRTETAIMIDRMLDLYGRCEQ